MTFRDDAWKCPYCGHDTDFEGGDVHVRDGWLWTENCYECGGDYSVTYSESYEFKARPSDSMIPFLVGRDDEWNLIWAKNLHEMPLDDRVLTLLEVWSARLCYPEIDVESVFDRHGEDNPEISPLEQSWNAHLGPQVVGELQKSIDALIQSKCQPFYMCEKKLGSLHQCPQCEGYGQIEDYREPIGSDDCGWISCPSCDGDGFYFLPVPPR